VYHYFDFVFLRSVLRLIVTANVPSSPILVTLLTSSETSVLRRGTRRNIPEEAIIFKSAPDCTVGLLEFAQRE
jgi:hypothetical protein